MKNLYAQYKIPDGYMLAAPHAKTADENKKGGTISSVYLLEGVGEVCLIDSGNDDIILNQINTLLKRVNKPLKYIFLTHDHYDHVGNAGAVQNSFGGLIVSHEKDKFLIEDPMAIYDEHVMRSKLGASLNTTFREMNTDSIMEEKIVDATRRYFNCPQKVNEVLSCGDNLEFGGICLEVVHTPGHSPGSISLYNKKTKSIYIGDLSFWINPARPYPIGDASKLIKSLELLNRYELNYMGPGHYKGFEGGNVCHKYINTLLSKALQLEEAIMKNLSSKGCLTVDELAKLIFPVLPEDNYYPIPNNSIHSFLCKLRAEGRVITAAKDNQETCWIISPN